VKLSHTDSRPTVYYYPIFGAVSSTEDVKLGKTYSLD